MALDREPRSSSPLASVGPGGVNDDVPALLQARPGTFEQHFVHVVDGFGGVAHGQRQIQLVSDEVTAQDQGSRCRSEAVSHRRLTRPREATDEDQYDSGEP